MQLTIKHIRWILVATLAVLLALSILLYLNMRRLDHSYRSVAHTREVQLKLEEIVNLLVDAETGSRGFMLSDDSSFLQPKVQAQKKVERIILGLQGLTSDNPEQQRNIRTLHSLAKLRFARIDSSLAHYRHYGRNDPGLQGRLEQGKFTMDRIRLLVMKMKEIENSLLQNRESTKQWYAWITPVMAIGLMLFALFIIILIFHRLIGQLRISQTYQQQLQQTNLELLQKKDALESTNEELESFNYIASHDLKEPVRKIKTFGSIILESDFERLSEKGKHNFQRILYAADKMQLLLEDLFAYTRVNTAQEERKPVDLNTVADHVIESLKERIDESGAQIEKEPLPQVIGIRFQLEQLFENLLSNALKYREPSRTPRIRIRSELVDAASLNGKFAVKSAAYHRLVFSDNGLGFRQEFAGKVFELFSRLHADKNFPGTGVGLTICKKIVQNHDGFIEAQSEEEKGSDFIVYLPAHGTEGR